MLAPQIFSENRTFDISKNGLKKSYVEKLSPGTMRATELLFSTSVLFRTSFKATPL